MLPSPVISMQLRREASAQTRRAPVRRSVATSTASRMPASDFSIRQKLRRSSQASTSGCGRNHADQAVLLVDRPDDTGTCLRGRRRQGRGYSASGTMLSFQASRGTVRNCLRKRPSVMAKSAKVSGTSIVAFLALLVGVFERVNRPVEFRSPDCLRDRSILREECPCPGCSGSADRRAIPPPACSDAPPDRRAMPCSGMQAAVDVEQRRPSRVEAVDEAFDQMRRVGDAALQHVSGAMRHADQRDFLADFCLCPGWPCRTAPCRKPGR